MYNLEKYFDIHSPGYVIEIYNNKKEYEYIIGNSRIKPDIKKVQKNTLYDIASLTKTFTAVLIYMAYEEKKIDINDRIFSIDNNFTNLKDVKVLDLLSHNQNIWTKGYLGDVNSKEEFYNVLFSAYVKEKTPTYVDVHYIILSYLLEKIYGKSFDLICKEKIFNVLGLKDITFHPEGLDCASNNYETLNGEEIDYIFPGIIHDTKARKAKELGIYTGHASIFSTGRDLLLFLEGLLNYKLLKKETIEFMLSHKDVNKENYEYLKTITSEDEINNMYEKALKINKDLYLPFTYNNMGVRYKNDISVLNDVPYIASDNSVSFSGYTGPMFTIDFKSNVIVVIMCNVMHNTKLKRGERKKITIEIMNDIFKNLHNC